MRAGGTATSQVSRTKKTSSTAPVVERSTTGIIACGTRDARPASSLAKALFGLRVQESSGRKRSEF
jgi:hypothetical protein